MKNAAVAMFTWTEDNTAATVVRDEHGMPFAQIRFGREFGADIAVLLLERGLARVDRDHLPERCGHYLEIERAARERGVGLWAN